MGPDQKRMLALLKEYNLELYLSPHGLGNTSLFWVSYCFLHAVGQPSCTRYTPVLSCTLQ